MVLTLYYRASKMFNNSIHNKNYKKENSLIAIYDGIWLKSLYRVLGPIFSNSKKS